jgi:uncharacterized protein
VKIVDANIFLRYLTADVPDQAERARRFFKRLESAEERATTNEAVLSEVVYVLASKKLYGLSPEAIESRLRPLLLLRGLHIPKQRRYLNALNLYATLGWADFTDALILAQMEDENIHMVVSFDQGFDNAEGIKRALP